MLGIYLYILVIKVNFKTVLPKENVPVNFII